MPHRVTALTRHPAYSHALRATSSDAIATLLLVIIALGSAHAQGMQANEADAGFETADGTVIAVRPEIEAPRELTVEEAEASLAARQERFWDEYVESLSAPGEAVEAREEPAVADVPAELGLPPQPDDPGGEISLQREQAEVWR